MLSLFATLALAVQIAAPVQDTAQARREELMSKLRSGEYSVLMRHARTDYSTQEPMGTIPAERSKQRNLSDDGISDAALMGVVFRRYGVSFAEVVSSPMFRTVETAEMAAGKPRTTMALRAIPATPEQEALVRAAPKAGTNRLLVTHHFVIEKHVPGITPGAVAESEAAVVSHAPDGSLRLVGIIHLADWKALANPGKPSAPTAAAGGATSPHAPPAHARVSIPNTPAAQLAHGYIGSFNSGEAAAMRSFMQPEDGTQEGDLPSKGADSALYMERMRRSLGTTAATLDNSRSPADFVRSANKASRSADSGGTDESCTRIPARIHPALLGRMR
jgi:phosphohistidine phosphatase SixA